MRKDNLKAIIAEAVSLDRSIALDTERLRQIKQHLLEFSAGDEERLVPTPSGGQSWQYEGNDGCIVRVSFPRDRITGNIPEKQLAKIRELAGAAFGELFESRQSYHPVSGFREKAGELLERSVGKRLLRACSSRSVPRVSFETKGGEK